MEPIAEIGAHFAIEGAFLNARALTSGHIHETFLAEYRRSGASSRFIHQRLNGRVFGDLPALMSNLSRVTRHQRAVNRARGVRDVDRRSLTLVPARDGRTFHIDSEGETWRTFVFVERSHCVDQIAHPEQAFEIAQAFGRFAADLSDLDPGALAVTLPGFHDLPGRYRALEAAADDDAHGRRAEVEHELERAHRAFAALESLRPPTVGGRIRIVHNDCKINNVLLDETTGEGLCVIDLDTVMAGRIEYDFGELVRTATCPSPEDEIDLGAMRLDLALFSAAASGYLAGAVGSLDDDEIAGLPLAGRVMALENALRFLADHIAGDVYFRVHRPRQNLDRARAQLQLTALLARAQAEIDDRLEQATRAVRS